LVKAHSDGLADYKYIVEVFIQLQCLPLYSCILGCHLITWLICVCCLMA